MGNGDLARAVCALRGNGTFTCVGPHDGVNELCRASSSLCGAQGESPKCTPAQCPPDVDNSLVPRQQYDFVLPSAPRGFEAHGHGLAFWFGDAELGMQSFQIIGGGGLCSTGGSVRAYAMALGTDGGRYCSIAPQPRVRDGQPVLAGEHVTCPGMGYVQKGNTTTCGSPPEIVLP